MVTTALAGAIVAGMFWLIARKQLREEDWVRHTLAVRNQLANVLILVQRTESGQRGYLLTERDVYLEPYDAAVEGRSRRSTRPRAGQRQSTTTEGGGRNAVAHQPGLHELRATIDARKAGRPRPHSRSSGRTTANVSWMRVNPVLVPCELRRTGTRGAPAERIGLRSPVTDRCRDRLPSDWRVGALVGNFTRRAFCELMAARDQLMITNEALVDQAGATHRSREPASPGPEDGSDRAVERRHRARLQQHAGRDQREPRADPSGASTKATTVSIDYMETAAMQGTRTRAAALTHRLLAFGASAAAVAGARGCQQDDQHPMSELLRSTLGEQVRIETVQCRRALAHQGRRASA